MKNYKMVILALAMSSTMLTGCDSIKEKFSKEEQVEVGYQPTPEQQALIGTYTEEGALIVGFDESGWMITEEVDNNVATSNQLGLEPKDYLSNTTYYDSVTIVTRDDTGTVLNTAHYQMDYDNRIGKKDWFTKGKSIGTTYYDNYSSKLYTNTGMVGWEQQSGERFENIIMSFDVNQFTLEEFTSDNSFVYVKGTLNREAAASNTVLMKEIYKQLNTLTGMSIFNMYDINTNELVRAEVTVHCPQGDYVVSAVPEKTSYFIEIPDYVLGGGVTPEVTVDSEITNIPQRAFLYSALYNTTDASTITRDWLISEYEFKSAELKKNYGVEDVELFLQLLQDIDDNTAVDEFLTQYSEKADNYSSNEEKAVYSIIHDRLIELDTSLTEDIISAMVLKELEEESTIEVLDISGTEESTEESTEEESTEETEEAEEPEYTVWYCNGVAVNKRTGPGTNYDKAGQVVLDEEVWVIGQAEENAEWSECIDKDGNTYYIKTSFLRQ
jgi:hypothetical protein